MNINTQSADSGRAQPRPVNDSPPQVKVSCVDALLQVKVCLASATAGSRRAVIVSVR